MMRTPLLMKTLFERAERLFPRKEIVSRTHNGVVRYTYREYCDRTRRLSTALARLGVDRGDRVGTLAWNHHRHLEAYFAIPCMGAVLHTLNIRLFPDQLAYIINHAEDKVLLVDPDLIPLVERIAPDLRTVQAYVIMADGDAVPDTTLSPVYAYEALLSDAEPMYPYPDDIDEHAPMGMCYTSATTGNPKGVVYSHRGIYLHSMAGGLADTIALSERDAVMPIVPMFHANAWGLPFGAVWFGAKQVLPGPGPTPDILLDLMEQEGVTLAAAVPTIWTAAARALEQKPRELKLRLILCGGSAAPPALMEMYERRWGIPFIHGYGMTETAPLASVARVKSYLSDLPYEEQVKIRGTQGMVVPGLEIRLVGPDGDVPWNGRDMGELWIRGPWIADEYYHDERTKDSFQDGWLKTGDVATIDEEGYIHLVDRTKDLVKSGGEWISSVDLENALMAHPAVFEAAVIGVPHAKWVERPLAVVALKDEYKGKVDARELLDFLRDKFAKWWIPDNVVFVDEIPKTSVGKFLKRELRETYRDYYASAAES
ncbi:MAG: long-chain fatty acid--CoA ligase [Thermoflavifilum sp.]|nr:long-chain fatty acid--CoA ligase [Thermoflavifilum sp.]MCL6513143.1 long-chain fatty acid--CoA ligase [Alicyclobacillus sp.]